MSLTIQFTQLTTLTNFSYFDPHVRSELLLDFLAANTLSTGGCYYTLHEYF